MMRNFYLLLIAFCLLNLAVFAEDQPKPPPRDINVSGQAKTKVKPDMATIRFAIINTNKDAEKARTQNEQTSKEKTNFKFSLKPRLRQIAVNCCVFLLVGLYQNVSWNV